MKGEKWIWIIINTTILINENIYMLDLAIAVSSQQFIYINSRASYELLQERGTAFKSKSNYDFHSHYWNSWGCFVLCHFIKQHFIYWRCCLMGNMLMGNCISVVIYIYLYIYLYTRLLYFKLNWLQPTKYIDLARNRGS